ncbi:MAG: hypothetical protein ACOX3I_09905 [Limnochordia bacterium]
MSKRTGEHGIYEILMIRLPGEMKESAPLELCLPGQLFSIGVEANPIDWLM